MFTEKDIKDFIAIRNQEPHNQRLEFQVVSPGQTDSAS